MPEPTAAELLARLDTVSPGNLALDLPKAWPEIRAALMRLAGYESMVWTMMMQLHPRATEAAIQRELAELEAQRANQDELRD